MLIIFIERNPAPNWGVFMYIRSKYLPFIFTEKNYKFSIYNRIVINLNEFIWEQWKTDLAIDNYLLDV